MLIWYSGGEYYTNILLESNIKVRTKDKPENRTHQIKTLELHI